MKYSLVFDFDCEGDPPTVFIAQPDGSKVIEVYDEPTCEGEWSWDTEKWKPGVFTRQLLDLMNAYA